MATKMKGLLKGLRYISQIFDPNCKEQEMQIGFPTDVKHVAHIGWDGPSLNTPSWVNEFRSEPLRSPGTEARGVQTPPKFLSQGIHRPCRIQDSPARDRELPELPLPKPSRRHASSGPNAVDSPSRDSSSVHRQSRRNKSAGVQSIDSPSRDSSDGSTRHSRRHHHGSTGTSGTGTESPVQDLPAIPKQSRRKKSKGSSGGGSSRSSRSKALASSYSEPDADGRNGEPHPVLMLTAEEGRV